MLVKWRGNYLLHLVKEVQGDQLLIGNNLGKVNGWVPASAVVGKVIAVGALAEAELPKSTQRARCYWLPLFLVAVINFTVYVFVCAQIGGDAVNGFVGNGRYYFRSRGVATEVSRGVTCTA